MNLSPKNALCAVLLLALPLVIQAQTVVYHDSFDDGTRATNTNGVGGIVGNKGTAGDSWQESNGRLAYSGARGGNRANVYTQNAFDLPHGFVLSVDYQHNFVSGGNRQFQFGLFQDWNSASTEPPLINASVNKAGIGFNLLPGALAYSEGLILSDAGEVSATFTTLSPFVTDTGIHNLTLKVTPDGNGGANWTYSYDGGPEVTGHTEVFDFETAFTFVGHARDGGGKFINEVTLTALPKVARGTVIMVSSLPVWLLLMCFFFRRDRRNRHSNQ